MSVDLATKIQLGLEEFGTVRDQMSLLIAKPRDSKVGVIETAAAWLLHELPRAVTRGPRPLEIEAAEVARYVHRLADEI